MARTALLWAICERHFARALGRLLSGAPRDCEVVVLVACVAGAAFMRVCSKLSATDQEK